MRKRFVIMVAIALNGCAGSQAPKAVSGSAAASSPSGAGAVVFDERNHAWPIHAGMEGAVAIESRGSVDDSVVRLQNAIKAKGLTLFATIDHTGNANGAGLKLRPTVLIIFGNPKVGTQLMDASPSLAMSLPMKILIYQANDNTVWVVHEAPTHLANRHQLRGKEKLLGKIAGVLRGLSNIAANAEPSAI